MSTISDTTAYSMSTEQQDEVLNAALETLRWTAITFNDPEYPDGTELDGSCFADAEWARASVESLDEDVYSFLEQAIEADLLTGLDTAQVGHDFILTAQGQGAGFWDRGLGERGDRLTALCRPYNFEVYVGDDRLLHL